jgi:uncharacterized pyridoxamine 5'-phosphate oxidase family protein
MIFFPLQNVFILYSYNKHNEVNINLGYIKAEYAKDNVRGNIAFMTGTYVNKNLAHESGVLKNIFEATNYLENKLYLIIQ